jgi:cobalt-zinc-cadmium efflux system protein
MHNHFHTKRKLGIVFAVSVSIFVVELVGGILSNSLALISDSMHILVDFVAIGLSLAAFSIADRPHTEKLSFGFHRIEVVAAFLNGITLIAITAIILYEAYRRFLEPSKIDTSLLLGFAFVGLIANLIMIMLLKKESKSNLNVKGSYVHIIGDLVSTVAVIAGGITLIFVPNGIIDVIIGIGIGLFVLKSGISLCRECMHIFMEGTPHEIKLDEISDEFEKFQEITDVHDLHVWTLTSNMYAMSAHVKVRDEYAKTTDSILRKINRTMSEKFGINHCTIQIETEHNLIHPDKD